MLYAKEAFFKKGILIQEEDPYCYTNSDMGLQIPSNGDIYELYTLEFTKKCPLFKGHFPFNPILPGIAIVQIVHALLPTGYVLKKASFKRTIKKTDNVFIELMETNNTRMFRLFKDSTDYETIAMVSFEKA